MSKDPFQTIVLKERELLREELFRLKECQNFFINLGITASSALLAYLTVSGGIAQKFTDVGIEPPVNVIYLIPLILILPIWLIFFDKATTISRIVGYYMILEQFINGKHPQEKYQGWENSLNLLRSFNRKQEKCIKKTYGNIKIWDDLSYSKKISYLFRTLLIWRPSINQYRKTVFLGFFILSMMCLFFSIAPSIFWAISTGADPGAWFVRHLIGIILVFTFIIIVLIITKYNLKILYQLARGFHSYNASYIFWYEILINDVKPHQVNLSLEDCQFPDHWIDKIFPSE